MSVSSEYTEEEEEEFRDDMRVFLRLRPINKLEQSRRSKNCIELHEDPTLVTVDSPLEGEYDYTFDHVFEEIASQQEVYEESVGTVPHALLEGYNCTVIAYGQTGTGKTHTMLGVNPASKGLLQNTRSSSASQFGNSQFGATTVHESQDETRQTGNNAGMKSQMSALLGGDADADPECQGMIPRTISALFELLQKQTGYEFTIRVSYIEIYLEKILDLLNPHGGGASANIITIDDKEAADVASNSDSINIKGASELCCLDESDVLRLLARGNACRTMSATEMNTESSRSHAIFILQLTQTNHVDGTTKTCVLHMADLAGSELASKDANKRKSMAASLTSVQREAAMINKSLSALNKMIRAQLAHQQGEQVPLAQISRQSKLTRVLRPSFGGNCLTTLLLTASPSSYNIGETISTINFGQRCRRIYNDFHVVPEEQPASYYETELKKVKEQYQDAMALCRALATECLKVKEGTATEEGPLWDTIAHLGRNQATPIDFKVTIKKKTNVPQTEEEEPATTTIFANERVQLEDEIENLKEEVEYMVRQRQGVESTLGELQSEVAVLRTQNENLATDKKRHVEELVFAKNEVQVLSQRKLEVEHNLRTSQFRENEAIVFLRQFRRFYRNVLKDKAAHGAGSILAITAEVTDKVPNAPNLDGLRDVDCLLVESGLLEEYEVNEDKSSGSYLPSKEALLRSATAAQRATQLAAQILNDDTTDDEDDDSAAPYIAQTITRVAGPLRLPGPGESMRAVAEMRDDSNANHTNDTSDGYGDEDEDDTDNDYEADLTDADDADAGAGAVHLPLDDRSVLSTDTGSLAHSIGRAPATGHLVQRRQRVLKTPAGRLTSLREQTLDKELVDIRERCIDLQLALTEQLAIVDALTNKSGGLSKKRLAQEAISLRQQLEKKTASLTAIAWKMNELNLINKTYNEKMANREQHVLYLEEQLVELQNNNRRLIVDRSENEKKLREEIDNLQRVVGGMSVPLWQFGETDLRDKPLGTRLILTSNGTTDEEGGAEGSSKRRKSIGAKERDMEFPEIPDVLFEEFEHYSDEGRELDRDHSMQSMGSIDEDNSEAEGDDDFQMNRSTPKPVEEPKRPKRRPSEKLRLSVNRIKMARLLAKGAMDSSKEFEESDGISIKSAVSGVVTTTASTQTDQVQVFDDTEEVIPVSQARAMVPEPETKPEMAEMQIQTDEVQVFDAGVLMEPARQHPDMYDADVQTEEVQVYDMDMYMVPEVIPPDTFEVDVQTDPPPELFHMEVQTDAPPEMNEFNMQTEEVQVFDMDTHMVMYKDPVETYEADAQTDEVQVFDMSRAMAPEVDKPKLYDADMQTEDVQIFDMNLPMIPDVSIEKYTVETQTMSHETAETAMQTDEEPMKEVYEVDVQTDEVEFVVHVDTNEAHVQTEAAATNTTGSMTDAIKTTDAESMTEAVEAQPRREMGTMTESADEEEPAGSRSAAVGSRSAVIDDDDLAHDVAMGSRSSRMSSRMSSHTGSSGDQSGTMSNNSGSASSSSSRPQQQQQQRHEDRHEDSVDDDDSGSEGEYGFTTDESSEFHEARHEVQDTTDDEFQDSIEEMQDNQHASESEDSDEEGSATESAYEESIKDDQSSEFDYEGALLVGPLGHDKNSLLGAHFEKEEEEPDFKYEPPPTLKVQEEEEHAPDIVIPEPEPVPVPEPESPVVVPKKQLSRSLSPVSRFMPEENILPPASKSARGASRFMPEDDLPVKSKSARGASRFMPEDANKDISRRPPNRRFLTSDGPGSAQRLTSRDPSASSILEATAESGLGSNDELEYDELGKRWGLSEDEIAADAAVLNTPRREGQGLLTNSDDEDDYIEDEVVEQPEELLPEDSNNSEDGFERDLFESEIDYLRRSSHSKESMERHMIGSSHHSESDEDEVEEEEEEEEAREKDLSSHPDDDFEKMMTETAAALAAADDLIGTNGEDNAMSTYNEDDDDTPVENDYEVELSDENDEYFDSDSNKSSDEEVDADEFRSAQDENFGRNESSRASSERSASQNESPKKEQPKSNLLEGGKSRDYQVVRFAKKVGKGIKSATVNPLSAKINASNVDDDEGSMNSMSSGKNREAPQPQERSPAGSRSPASRSPASRSVTLRIAETQPDSARSSKSGLGASQKEAEGDREERQSRRKKPSSSRHHRSSRRVDGNEGERRRHRSSRHVDGEEGEKRRHKSRRNLDGDRHKSRRSLDGDKDSERKDDDRRLRKSRRSLEDGEGRERRHKSRRSLEDKEDKEGGDDERRHRSSRRRGTDDGGEERRHRSSRRPKEGEEEDGERRHRSSRREKEGEGEDRDRRRRKKSHREPK